MLDQHEGVYAYKNFLIKTAIQMDVAFQIENEFGVEYGKKGDYFCETFEGFQFIIEREIFEKFYVKVNIVGGSVTPSEEKESLRDDYIRLLNEAVDENGKWKYLDGEL